MAELESSKDLISVLWSGADILRSKMDANEYKDYLLGIVFYKYLSDSFLIKVYDLIYDEKPQNLKIALEAYKEALADDSAEELIEQIKSECHYVIEPRKVKNIAAARIFPIFMPLPTSKRMCRRNGLERTAAASRRSIWYMQDRLSWESCSPFTKTAYPSI